MNNATIPLDISVGYIYAIDPFLFAIAVPLIILIEALILWWYRLGSFWQVVRYSAAMNFVSGVIGFVLIIPFYPVQTPEIFYWFYPLLCGFMFLLWMGAMYLSALLESYVLTFFKPENEHFIWRACLLANFITYLPLFFLGGY
jgi:hypothetical protein